MTCGIPIVASVSGYSKRRFGRDRTVGLVSESHSVDHVVQHILTLSRDSQLRARFSYNALQYVQQHFLWENNIRILTRVIENKVSVNKVYMKKFNREG